MKKNAGWLRRAVVLLSALSILLATSVTFAAGRVQWKSKKLKEVNESWKIEVTFFLHKAPDIAHMPVRFSFQPTAYFERMLDDDHKDKPVTRKVPLNHRQPLVESVDVGFLDPANGNIQKRTRFSFKVTRGHGFEAGEYKVTIKGPSGTIGRPTRLVFNGENKVIDRRSIVFSGKKKKKKEEPKEEQPVARELSPDDPAFWEGGPTESEEDEEYPGEINEKPGGCGCRLGAAGTGGGAATLLLAGFIGAFAARRRRSPRVAGRLR